MSTEMDQLCADVTAGARAWNEDGGSENSLMPSKFQILDGRRDQRLADDLRHWHGMANTFRMAEAIAAERVAVEKFVDAYGVPPHDLGAKKNVTYEEWFEIFYDWKESVYEVYRKRGGSVEDGEQMDGDVIAQLLATADDGADDGAGAGRSARAEEPRRAFGEER
jgi:hypothetical protein